MLQTGDRVKINLYIGLWTKMNPLIIPYPKNGECKDVKKLDNIKLHSTLENGLRNSQRTEGTIPEQES